MWGVADTEGASLQAWVTCQAGKELALLCPFTSQRGLLQGPGLGLGSEVTEQRVPSGKQDVWYVLVQAQSPSGGVGETVHPRD